MKPLNITENYVAWCRYVQVSVGTGPIETCNSDDPGAFKVFRQTMIDKAYSIGYKHGMEDAPCDKCGEITTETLNHICDNCLIILTHWRE